MIYAESKKLSGLSNKSRMHSTGILLAAVVLGLFLVTGPLATAASIPFAFASTTEEGGGNEENTNEGNNEGSTEEEESSEEETEPEPEPQVPTDPVPAEPLPTVPTEPVLPLPEPEPIECPEGFVLSDTDTCVPEEPEVGAAFSPPAVLPYCDTVPDDYGGACHDRYDYDEETGLYPCNDGTQVETAEECPDISDPLETNQTDPSPQPSPSPSLDNQTDPGVIVDVGDNQTDPGDNQTYPIPLPPCEDENQTGCEPIPLPPCEDENQTGCDPIPPIDPCDDNNQTTICDPPDDNDTNIDIDIFIRTVTNNVNNHGHNNFPDIDIIGLSTKDNGDSIMCLMNIDNSWIQCQEFGMDPQRVNSDFWRVIETDHDKDYDNGNTGSDDIDDAIEDVKSQDFSELDDADNHDFGVDLGWIAINPQGGGVTCVTTDQSGKGKSLCEPFKVDNTDVDGQITEGFEFEN